MENTYRFYGQAIGEDEAGNLPSCYAWMGGLELTAPEMKFPTTVSIEAIDTRIKSKLSMDTVGQILCIIMAFMIILTMKLY